MTIIYLSVSIMAFLIQIKLAETFAEIDYIDDTEYQQCMCVPYWQCKEDYSGLIEDGIDLMDIRDLKSNEDTQNATPCSGDFEVCCQIECGKRRSLSSEATTNNDHLGFRILGENNEATFAEFPWMLGILEDDVYRCGASLIHPQVALTAAHCVTGRGPFKIRAGEWNWAEQTEPRPHQERAPLKIVVHPQYHAPSLRNDIALLILETPFKLAENVGLVCLPDDNQVDTTKCVATGWGKNSYKKGTYQSVLKKMELPLVPRDKCLRTLQQARLGPFFNLHVSFICAGGETNKDTCKGDGGSPLMCPVVGQNGRYEQFGIVAWGLTCGVQSTPGVYVNIGLFRVWIDRTVEAYGFNSNVYKHR